METPEIVAKRESNSDIKLPERKMEFLRLLSELLEKEEEILAAKVYGSWLYLERSLDLDIAIMVPSENSIVIPDTYRKLKIFREEANRKTEQDVDIIPHTQDELGDFRSPFYHPKYNPALVDGRDIKGKMDIRPSHNLGIKFGYEDIAACMLYDNRTICRRQIIRSLNAEEGRVFVSKILHGPTNALTYGVYKRRTLRSSPPSNWIESLREFDTTFRVNSEPALDFLRRCETNLDFDTALKLLGWYERLIMLVLHDGDNLDSYKIYCEELNNNHEAAKY